MEYEPKSPSELTRLGLDMDPEPVVGCVLCKSALTQDGHCPPCRANGNEELLVLDCQSCGGTYLGTNARTKRATGLPGRIWLSRSQLYGQGRIVRCLTCAARDEARRNRAGGKAVG